MADKSLSIIIPAFNEEGNIRAACLEVVRFAEKHLTDYELLVFDDKSLDRTAEIVQELQKENSRIILYRNTENKGLGYNYRTGLINARCAYTMLVPGDNEVASESIDFMFGHVGKADVIICYIANPEVRTFWRRAFSSTFTGVLNFLFGLKLHYYNGTSIIRTDLARQFVPETSGFAYMAMMLVRLIRAGSSYQEIPFSLWRREHGRTKAFRPKNIASVIKNIMVLFWEVVICRKVSPQAARNGKLAEEARIDA